MLFDCLDCFQGSSRCWCLSQIGTLPTWGCFFQDNWCTRLLKTVCEWLVLLCQWSNLVMKRDPISCKYPLFFIQIDVMYLLRFCSVHASLFALLRSSSPAWSASSWSFKCCILMLCWTYLSISSILHRFKLRLTFILLISSACDSPNVFTIFWVDSICNFSLLNSLMVFSFDAILVPFPWLAFLTSDILPYRSVFLLAAAWSPMCNDSLILLSRHNRGYLELRFIIQTQVHYEIILMQLHPASRSLSSVDWVWQSGVCVCPLVFAAF